MIDGLGIVENILGAQPGQLVRRTGRIGNPHQKDLLPGEASVTYFPIIGSDYEEGYYGPVLDDTNPGWIALEIHHKRMTFLRKRVIVTYPLQAAAHGD